MARLQSPGVMTTHVQRNLPAEQVPDNLPRAIVKLAYRLAGLKPGRVYGIMLVKRSNDEVVFSVDDRGKVEVAA